MLHRGVFLDRDGTINKDVPYCSRPEDFQLLPTVPQGIRALNEHRFKVVVVTNQSGIARGYFSEEMLARIHQKLGQELAREGARVDAIYYCPHHPDDGCSCRKPQPTLLFQAASDLEIDLRRSYVMGDKDLDIEMGQAAGCGTVLVPGESPPPAQELSSRPDFIAQDLYQGAQWIISHADEEVK